MNSTQIITGQSRFPFDCEWSAIKKGADLLNHMSHENPLRMVYIRSKHPFSVTVNGKNLFAGKKRAVLHESPGEQIHSETVYEAEINMFDENLMTGEKIPMIKSVVFDCDTVFWCDYQ